MSKFLMRFYLFISFIFFWALNVHAHKDGKGSGYVFTENKGQWNEQVYFKAEVGGATIYFENNAFHYQFVNIPDYHLGNQPKDEMIRGHIFKARFVGSNQSVSIGKKGSSSFYNNYFIGNDSSKWRGFIRSYQSITYENLYNGIDLKVYQNKGFLKYDYHVNPGTPINIIKVAYEGADHVRLKDGNIVINHSLGKMIEEKPYAFQIIDGEKINVSCNYVLLEDNTIGFEFPEGYNEEKELIIDPTLIFSTYSGSSADNFGQTATYDNLGNGYMGGIASRIGYITTVGAFQRFYSGGDWDIAISKFNSTGDLLLYSTYIGGSNAETVHSMVVDDSLNLYIFGATGSTNFPTSPAAHQNFKVNSSGSVTTDINVTFNGGTDIFVTKFNSTGTALLGSTYFGDVSNDGINQNLTSPVSYSGLNANYGDYHRGEIVIDSMGFCYVGTTTYSNGLSTIPGNSNAGGQDGLIIKFNNNLSAVVWSRYLGGSARDAVNSLKVIDNNRVLVGGGTTSFNDFPTTTGSYAPNGLMGEADGFISIISADGTTVDRSTYIGTVNYDQVYFIEFDRFDNVYAYGQSEGGVFPIKNSPNSDLGAGQFLIKMDKNLDSLEFSKTFGDGQGVGALNISPTAFLVDKCQNLYAAGWGGSIRPNQERNKQITNNMQVVSDTIYGARNNSAFYLYVTYLDPTNNQDTVLYSNFLGGSNSGDHVDGGTSRFDKNGVVYHSVCASCGGNASDFPTDSTAFSRTNNSPNCNNLLFKLDFEITIDADFSVSESEICLEPGKIDSITVFNNSPNSDITTWSFYGDTVSTKFVDTTVYFSTPGSYLIRQVVFDTVCAIGDFKDIRVFVRPDDINLSLSVVDSVECLNDSIELIVSSGGSATEFLWSRDANFTNPIALNPSDSTPKVQLQPGNNRFYLQASDPTRDACEKIDSIDIFYFPVEATASASADTVCFGSPVQFTSTLLNVDSFAWDFGNSVINFTDTNPLYTYPIPGTYTVNFYYRTDTCNTSKTITFDVTVLDNDLSISLKQDTLYCGIGDLVVSANTSGTAIKSYLWSSSGDFTDTLNVSLNDDSFVINKADSGTFYLKISNNFCEATDSTHIVYVPYAVQIPILNDTACFTNFELEFEPVLIGTDSFRINFGNGSFTTTDPSPLIQYSQPGDYTIEVLGYNSICIPNDTATFNINLLPNNLQFSNIQDTITCNLVPVDLVQNTNGTANQFIWSSSPMFSDTLNSSLSDSSITVNPNSTSEFYIKISDGYCFKEDSLTVEPLHYDLQLGSLPDSVCTGFQQVLSTTVIGLDSFRINYGMFSTTNNTTPTISPTSEGIYQVELIGSNARCNFNNTISDSIRVFQSVDLEPIMDSLICSGDTIVITANTFGTGQRFTWDDSPLFESPFNTTDTFILVSPIQASRYYFKAENVICSAEDSVLISTEFVEVDTDDLLSFCLDDTVDVEAFVNIATTPLSFNWTPSSEVISGQNTTQITISPDDSLKLFLETTSATGCKDFDTVEVEVNTPAFTDATIFLNDSLYKGQTTQLSTDRNGSNLIYLWEPVDGLNDPNSPNPSLTVDQSQEYKVTITDLNTGCVVVAFKRLTVFEINCNEPDIFIPTAFTPNNDLSNDVLYVRGANLREIDFQLFNRWGELVFETTDKNTGWDGTYKGKKVNPGVFAYQLRAICFDGQEYYTKGNITLIR